MRLARVASTLLLAALLVPSAQAQLRCGPFSTEILDPSAPRSESHAVATFNRINAAVKTQPHRVLYLGDSITERWNLPLWGSKQVWDAHMPQRGVLNAGVSGDRTEHLRWRLDHGNLDGPAPKGVIVMIGTNDLGHGRAPEVAAQGIRAVLLRLREKLPAARILLLGLTPRGTTAEDRLRQAVVRVNKLIPACADGQVIAYADIGGSLLEPNGTLSRGVAPDLLHFNSAGYARLAPQLDTLIDKLFSTP